MEVYIFVNILKENEHQKISIDFFTNPTRKEKPLRTDTTPLQVLDVWQGADQNGETLPPLRVSRGPLG